MRFQSVLSIAAAVAMTNAQQPPRLPRLPSAFEAWVTCNIVDKNYTVVVHEVYDQNSQRALLQQYHPVPEDIGYVPPPVRNFSSFNFSNFNFSDPNAFVNMTGCSNYSDINQSAANVTVPPRFNFNFTNFTNTSGGFSFNRTNFTGFNFTRTPRLSQDYGFAQTLYDYGATTYYHTNSSGCWAGNLSRTRVNPDYFTTPQNGAIPSVSQWFEFAATGEQEVYMGQTSILGEPVDWWQSNITLPGNITFGRTTTTMILDYYFSVQPWAVWNGNATVLPVMLNLTGEHPLIHRVRLCNGSRAYVDAGEVRTFNHVYYFNNFHVGPPRNPLEFSLPAGTQCVSLDGVDASNAPVIVDASAPSSSGSSSGISGGGVAAVALVTLIIGVVVGVAAARHTGKARSSSSSSVKNPTFKNPAANDDQDANVVAKGNEYDEGLSPSVDVQA